MREQTTEDTASPSPPPPFPPDPFVILKASNLSERSGNVCTCPLGHNLIIVKTKQQTYLQPLQAKSFRSLAQTRTAVAAPPKSESDFLVPPTLLPFLPLLLCSLLPLPSHICSKSARGRSRVRAVSCLGYWGNWDRNRQRMNVERRR